MIDYFVDPAIGRNGCEILVLESFDMSLADFFATAQDENRMLNPRQYCTLAQKLVLVALFFHRVLFSAL